ncbi:3-deoxy-D-manno-octulosonic acid transferase [Oleiharenicola sp. Vm1]|uniref:3-deoxy-D-manno-octulosonic acid transferase n=1 Tax=Oleiharenicola sp. Vm1 TaxID=3398393 RepID=UPI0039F62C3A
MIWVYRLLFLPALLLAAPYYLWRMRKRGGYAVGFGGRFGEVPELPAKSAARKRVWLQAVSVGEMLAIGPLLEGLKRDGCETYLTTTTSTGYALAKEKYALLTIGIGYFPLDFWAFSARAWRQVQPDLCVLMEGERWPEHVRAARGRGVPVVSVNARLSDRSFRRSVRFKWALRPLAAGITRVLASAKRDEQRFRALGFPAERLQTTGNLKLDVAIPLLDDAARVALRRAVGLPAGGLVLLGSSTWPGEEEALLEALRRARADGHDVSLLLVPRHAERREELRGLLERSGFSFHFRSEGAAPRTVDVAVGDTTGELRQLTQLADLVFVGKSLPPHDGGQTPVEAAILGKPVLHGPRMTNFRDIIRSLTEADAVRRVATHAELVRLAVELLENAAEREQLAAAARAWSAANRGATERTLAVLRAELAARA